MLFDSQNRTVIATTEPGYISVWYFIESMVEGRYTKYDTIPDGIVVHAKFGAVELPVHIDKSTMVNVHGDERKSAFTVVADKVGEYDITIRHMPKGMRFAVTFGRGLKSFMIGFIQFGFGTVILVVAFVLIALAAANVFPKRTNA
ncbi:MAG: hypothetical protein JNN01_09780 [Opitutaceae bacterium]|nr:hypothetical protein [Opitutaceae bacterium]